MTIEPLSGSIASEVTLMTMDFPEPFSPISAPIHYLNGIIQT